MVMIMAIKKCGCHPNGTVFNEAAIRAKALVALQRARYLSEDEKGIYQTKDLRANQLTRYRTKMAQSGINASKTAADSKEKKRRGRPKNTTIEDSEFV